MHPHLSTYTHFTRYFIHTLSSRYHHILSLPPHPLQHINSVRYEDGSIEENVSRHYIRNQRETIDELLYERQKFLIDWEGLNKRKQWYPNHNNDPDQNKTNVILSILVLFKLSSDRTSHIPLTPLNPQPSPPPHHPLTTFFILIN